MIMNKKVWIFIAFIGVLCAICLIMYFSSLKHSIASQNLNAVLQMVEDDSSGILWPQQTFIDLNNPDSNPSKGVIVKEHLITLTCGGNYILTGNLTNGSITIDTKEPINLTLNNAQITNASGPAVYIKNSDQIFITLIKSTKNYFIDSIGANLSEMQAPLYNNDHVSIQGKGSLSITTSSSNEICISPSV